VVSRDSHRIAMDTRTHQVTEYELLGGRLLLSKTAAKDIVSIEGSVLGGSNFLSPTLESVPTLFAELLDAGTKTKSKALIRESLANCGITLHFSTSGDRTHFSAQCFPEDLAFLLSLIVECLREASIPASELDAARHRDRGLLAQAKTDTRSQASIALTRALFDPSHVNYTPTISESEKYLEKINRNALETFQATLGRGGLVLAITGDLPEADTVKAAERVFGKLPTGTLHAVEKKMNQKPNVKREVLVPIKDKANIDVFFGASLPLHNFDEDYHPLLVIVDMLGGGFTGHLIQTIRERDGLTYGVYAGLQGFDAAADGMLRIWATFSPELYGRGISGINQEVQNFFEKGLTDEALKKKKDEITGSYVVGLSTTRGLARALHQLAIDGRPLSYLSDFPDIIRTISLKKIKEAATLIPINKFSLAAAGTFPKK
jgi:zinc protease